MERDFVTFYSPGTIVAEGTERPIASWDLNLAVEMARDIVERHGARPFGFRFTTRARAESELDSKVIRTSGMYFLGGKVETIDEVRRRADPKEAILLSNLTSNRIEKIVVNENSYRWTQELREGDVVLDVDLRPAQVEA